MTLGTIAVVIVLAAIVAAIIWRQLRARRAGTNPNCGSCNACKSNKVDSGGGSSCHFSDPVK